MFTLVTPGNGNKVTLRHMIESPQVLESSFPPLDPYFTVMESFTLGQASMVVGILKYFIPGKSSPLVSSLNNPP